MKKAPFLVLTLLFFAGTISAQNVTVKSLIDNGISLYDHGRYYDAIKEYQQALAIDPKSAAANLEMANTYSALQNYQKAIEYCDIVIKLNDQYVDQAYDVKGSDLDLMNNLGDAIATYQEGIKKYPDNYLLLYNASLTCFKAKKYSECASYAAGAVAANPNHSSSHLMLGSCMLWLNKRPQSLLALYNFLLLEPDSKRSVYALDMLLKELKSGVSREEKNTINISLDPKGINDEFAPADLAISLMEASKDIDKNKKKSDEQLFFENTESFLRIIDKTEEADRKKSIWWTTYAPFYHDLLTSDNTEAFCYFICYSKHDDAVKKWTGAHKDKMDKLAKWREKYTLNNGSNNLKFR